MKKKAALIFVVLIAILGFMLYKSRHITDQGAMVETKKYINQSFGISFDYPKDYILNERNVGVSGVHHAILLVEDNQTNRDILSGKIKDTEGPPAITIDVYQNAAKENSVIDWVKTTLESNYNLSGATYSSTTVAGQPAVQYEWDGLYQGKSLVFSYKGNIIMVSATFIEHGDRTEKDFMSILKSIRMSS
ncbi:hypothetical protein KW783_01895 [Candidatus Parcubacteria bacterium]|nr:hypothetical protein [Candidatus Parcubacteria bacterium]